MFLCEFDEYYCRFNDIGVFTGIGFNIDDFNFEVETDDDVDEAENDEFSKVFLFALSLENEPEVEWKRLLMDLRRD